MYNKLNCENLHLVMDPKNVREAIYFYKYLLRKSFNAQSGIREAISIGLARAYEPCLVQGFKLTIPQLDRIIKSQMKRWKEGKGIL